MQLVSVIMKATDGRQSEPNEYSDTTRLLNYGFSHFKKYTINKENNQVNEILFNTFNSYFDQSLSPVQLENEASVILPKGVKLSQATQTVYYDKNQTLKSGENTIGQVKYTYGNHVVGNTSILYNNQKTSQYLNRASHKMVSTKISQLHTKKHMFSGVVSFFSNLHFSFINVITNTRNFFSSHLVILILIILFILLVMLNIWRYLSDTRMKRHKKRIRRERERRKEKVIRERMEARKHTKHIIQKSGQAKAKPARESSKSKKRSHHMLRVTKDAPVREVDKGYNPKKRKNRKSMDFTTPTRRPKNPSMGSVSLPDSKKFKNARKHTSESFGHNRFDQGKK